MSKMRPELSKKNPHYISKHQYYELYHFCLQYYEWIEELRIIDYSILKSKIVITNKNSFSDSIFNLIEKRLVIEKKINLVKETCKETTSLYYEYLFKAVTEGKSYTWLKTNMRIPCCKEIYFNLYHEFFYRLSRKIHST